MKKTPFFSFILAAAIFTTFTVTMSAQKTGSTTSTSGTAATSMDLKNTASALTKSWQDAYNREDAKTLGTMYSNQVTMIAPNGASTTESRENIVHNLENDFIVHSEQIQIDLGSAVALPDGRVRITGTYATSEVDPKTGEITKESGIFDHLLTKEAGVWKLSQTEVIPNL